MNAECPSSSSSKQGLDAAPGTPADFGARMKAEMAKCAKAIKAAGIKVN